MVGGGGESLRSQRHSGILGDAGREAAGEKGQPMDLRKACGKSCVKRR